MGNIDNLTTHWIQILPHFQKTLLVHQSWIQNNPSHHAKLSPTVAEQGTVRNASTSVTAMVAAR